jgi:ferritin-like metal-binding protein YciE
MEDTMQQENLRIGSLNDLYLLELQDMYDAESQIVNALPEMEGAATRPELKEFLTEHIEISEGHLERLERIFDSIGESPNGKMCEGVRGILREAQEMMLMNADPNIKDAALISVLQRVEHYEMASYGTLREWAKRLGRLEDADLIQQSLDDDGEADEALTDIAETVNSKMKAHI